MDPVAPPPTGQAAPASTSHRRNLLLFLGVATLCVGLSAAYIYKERGRWRDTPEEALQDLALPGGFRASLFAAEPMLSNPVAFCIDGQQRLYVVETSALPSATLAYSDEHLACRTWEEGNALRLRELERRPRPTDQPERLVLLEDRHGRGQADTRTVLLDDFPLSHGVIAGVACLNDRLWLANCPKLWQVPLGPDGRPSASPRELLHGFGVRHINLSHDLHGLTFGPDGKLYFTMGDRGMHVRAPGGEVVSMPDTGGVLRCDPDGSRLEVIAVGMRNPQRLAFDDHGNLWTADNDGNKGDRSRWLHVVEGGEYGWRVGFQPLPNLGVWNEERLWHPETSAPYRLPSLGMLGSGPAGLAHYPGTGLPETFDGCFFLADFTTGVQTVSVKPRGAGFELARRANFAGPLSPTDVNFGPDGALYVLDWGIPRTEMGSKGRVFRIEHREARRSALAVQTHRLLREGMAHRPALELGELLSHRDRRVRQAAQFALAGRGADALPIFSAVLDSPGADSRADGRTALGRLHAVWGLGQLAAGHPAALERVTAALADADEEVRSQAAKVLGEHRHAASAAALVSLLRDDSPRVRFFAALALGKTARQGRAEVGAAVVELLRANDDKDEFLRHAGVMALAGLGDVGPILPLRHDPSRAVRLGALLALRRLGRPEVESFLKDADPELVLEAARAIHDAPIDAALPALAALAEGAHPDSVTHRAVNANFRLGTPEAAQRLARLAASSRARPAARVAALEALAEWVTHLDKDRVLGQWRPLPRRDARAAADALQPFAGRLVDDRLHEVAAAATRAVTLLRVPVDAATLLAFLGNERVDPGPRADTLRLLAEQGDPMLPKAIEAALDSPALELRRQAVRLCPKAERSVGLTRLRGFAGPNEPLPIRQAAVAALAEWPDREAEGVLLGLMEEAGDGLRLDLLEAAASRGSEKLRQAARRLQALRPAGDQLAPWWECLEGGDAAAGRKIFLDNQAVSCLRCHKLQDHPGGEVGPSLSGVGKRLTRRALLESVVFPNAAVASGYEQVTLQLANGTTVVGRKVAETDTQVTLMQNDGRQRHVAKGDVEGSVKAPSAMPEGMAKLLSPRQLRDVVEFLASLKE